MTWWHRINEFVHRQNPWVNFILAAVSILVAIYLALPEKGLLGYRQSIIKIFDNNSAGTLRIVGSNNQPIESDVYAIETTLRNAGNFTFDHVRRYPQIRFPKGTVVETRVSESTDPDIMHVTAVQGSQLDTVEVKWRHFDPDQLVKITTLVASAEEVKPEVEATIVGVRIVEAAPDLPYPAPIAYLLMGVLGVVLGIGAVSTLSRVVVGLRERNFKAIVLNALWTIFLGAVASLFLVGLYLYWSAPKVP